MKSKNLFLQHLLLVVCFLVCSEYASADFTVVNEDGVEMNYREINGGVEVTYNNCYLGLKTIRIPTKVTYGGRELFVLRIGASCFQSCLELQTVILPDSLSFISDQAFNGCISLEQIAFPNTLKSIGSHAFSGCSSLKSIILPMSLIQVGTYAFSSCASLEEITIPSSVISLGYCSFLGCKNLNVVISHINNPKPTDAFSFPPKTSTLYVPHGTNEVYEQTDGWNVFGKIVEMDDITEGEPISLQAEMETFCSQKCLDFSNPSGPQAYIASGFEEIKGEVLLSKIYYVPANTGVILRGMPGQTYMIPFSGRDFVYSNFLVGVTEDTAASEGYILRNGLFEPITGSVTMKGGEAYLKIPVRDNKQLKIRFTDTITDVENIKLIEDTPLWHTLSGTCLSGKPIQKGIYLKNGRKVYVK